MNALHQASAGSDALASRRVSDNAKWCAASVFKKESENRSELYHLLMDTTNWVCFPELKTSTSVALLRS